MKYASNSSIYIHKANDILFNPHCIDASVDYLTLCINTSSVMQVTRVKFLGIRHENTI